MYLFIPGFRYRLFLAPIPYFPWAKNEQKLRILSGGNLRKRCPARAGRSKVCKEYPDLQVEGSKERLRFNI